MNIWEFIFQKIESGIPCVLLCVLESSGSSPGRQGFKMALAADEELYGSIGGGIMEHKFIEKAKDMLANTIQAVFYKKQYHHKNSAHNQSGMICSGEQSLALFPIYPSFETRNLFALIKQKNENQALQLSMQGIQLIDSSKLITIDFSFEDEYNWQYQEALFREDVIYIIGGGHVGLALSKQMRFLDFKVILIDDRPNLNTMETNDMAHQKIITPYEKINQFLQDGPNVYVVLITFGYRSDKLIFDQLKNRSFRYIGMMGSDEKIKTLLNAYQQEGLSEQALSKLHAPIGEIIFSKTPAEIAVSIAAQIIKEKNKDLPTGRKV